MTDYLVSNVYSNIFGSPGELTRHGKGWTGGYPAYRYGDEHSKVYNPAKGPAIDRKSLTAPRVQEVVTLLSGSSPMLSRWSREADTLIGLRRAFVSDGMKWSRADATARELIRRAFVRLGIGQRPDWHVGQRYYALENDCLWCGGALERGGKFCCAHHAQLALDHFDYETNSAASEVGRAAYRIIRREREDERECARAGCTHTFRPMSADSTQRYCGMTCKALDQVVVLEPRQCEYSGETFTPSFPGQRFATQSNATAALRIDNERQCASDGCSNTFKPNHGVDPERDKYCSTACAHIARATPKHLTECTWCGDPFLAKTKAGRFCCDAHYQAHRKATRGILPARLSGPVFDFVFAVAA